MGILSALFGNKSTAAAPMNPAKSVKPGRKANFEEKLTRILEQETGMGYTLRKNISVEELEEEFSTDIYSKGAKYCLPEAISYGIYQGNRRLLYIRCWTVYEKYSRTANRQIKEFCAKENIPLLDFFTYMPNEEDYMKQRILQQLP